MSQLSNAEGIKFRMSVYFSQNINFIILNVKYIVFVEVYEDIVEKKLVWNSVQALPLEKPKADVRFVVLLNVC